MANSYFNTQIGNDKEPKSGKGVMPKGGGPGSTSVPERTANWPGLPGKGGTDRSNGSPEEKIYATAKGLRGGKEVEGADESKGF
jgi:hypothetical protein